MLYRIYRPKTFAEIEGQEHIVRTLQGALSSGRIGHAYFFSGPRGTGKTTMARLFAKALNCEKRKGEEPCNSCLSCTEINANKSLDIIEIDAASHTGVDHVRELTDSANVAAPQGGHKIFIIDEVHMLSKAAFNALLKTLEEPPARVVFILATTEPHKVPETILSRVQRFDFKKLPQQHIVAKLKKIAKAEKLKAEDGALDLIARGSGGSLRDAESALGKVMAFAGSTISEEQASAILGIIPAHTHQQLLTNIHSKETAAAIAQIDALHHAGANLEHFAKQFIEYTREELLGILSEKDSRLTDGQASSKLYDSRFLVEVVERFMAARSEFKYTPIPQLPLELAIVDLTKPHA